MAAFDAVNGKNQAKSGRRPNGQFKRGYSGNPTGEGAGRPKGISLTRILREVLEEEGEDAARERVRKWLAHADEGRAPFFQEIWNRIDGKVPDKVLTQEVTTIALEWGDIGDSEATDSDAAAAPEPGANRIR